MNRIKITDFQLEGVRIATGVAKAFVSDLTETMVTILQDCEPVKAQEHWATHRNILHSYDSYLPK